MPLAAVFDTPGPMALDVAGLVRLHAAVTGQAVTTAPAPPRLALPRRGLFDGLHPTIARALEEALARWQAAGATWVDVDLADLLDEAIALQQAVGGACRLADVQRVLAARGAARSDAALLVAIETPSVQRYFAPPAPEAVAAVPARLARLDTLAACLAARLAAAGTALLLYPSTRQPPARLDAGEAVFATNYYGDNARVAPALGIPACSFVCARGGDGRPLPGANAEVAGVRGSDAAVLAASLWLERHAV